MSRTAPFGTWPSPITPAVAASGAVRLGGVLVDGADVYWLEGRPGEGGRTVLCRLEGDGSVSDVTPVGSSVRTRVHEMGGGACTVVDGTAYFCDDRDQRVWRQRGAVAHPVTPAGSARFADLTFDRHRDRLLAVCEDHSAGGEPVASIVAIALSTGMPETLVSGSDFYAAPRLSPDGARLAWLAWSHPRMPWEGTELMLATLDDAGHPTTPARIAGGPDESVIHPSFSGAGRLWFVSDRSGWWNLYRSIDGVVEPLAPMPAEFGSAPWVFGLSTYGFVGDETVVCAFQGEGTWRLGVLQAGAALAIVDSDLTEIAWVQGTAGRAVFAAGSPSAPMAIAALDLAPRAVTILHRPSRVVIDETLVSLPRPLVWATGEGAVAHGMHYPPRNPDWVAPRGTLPPLVVVSHGGPTAAAQTALSLAVQFWTSRGFAVLDVNYRGSTGYGRAYRRALDGQWGVVDVQDCVTGARHLVAGGMADEGRLIIRGGSAGGYTTLAALAFHDAFRAGASYYGVSDLETLARDTHKFESRYLDSLIGPYPERRDLYVARSPLHHAARFSCPVIFFQGLEDRVVPPAQAERMAVALRRKGLEAPYVTFADEQHGFRRAENIARALEDELAFYRRVLGLAEAEQGL